MPLVRQARVVVPNGQTQCPCVPGHGQGDVGAGMDRRVGHELADHQGSGGNDPAQPPVQQGTGDEVPRAARNFVTRTLLDWGLGRVISSASLVVSELVTNSTIHAGTDIALSVAWNAGTLRLTVRDNNPGLPHQRHSAPDLHGRGLTIVAGLSRAFGVLPTADGGKVVWAVFDAPGQSHQPAQGVLNLP